MNTIGNANCTSTSPALALVAKNSRTVTRNNRKEKVEKGFVRAVRLIAQQDAAGKNNAKRELMNIVDRKFFDRHWEIVECFA